MEGKQPGYCVITWQMESGGNSVAECSYFPNYEDALAFFKEETLFLEDRLKQIKNGEIEDALYCEGDYENWDKFDKGKNKYTIFKTTQKQENGHDLIRMNESGLCKRPKGVEIIQLHTSNIKGCVWKSAIFEPCSEFHVY